MYDNSNNQIVKSTSDSQPSSKTFVIDHPNKSEQFLVHACLEGPEAGVYYRGKNIIKNGEYKTQIKLPEYTSIFKNFTVHVTCVGPPVLLGVSDVIDGYFNVYSDKCVQTNSEFNWVVYATRNDINVEPFKSSTIVKGNGPYRWI